MANPITVINYNNAALSLPYYREQLQKTNPNRFVVMDIETRARERGRLLSTLAILRCEAQEDLESERFRKLHGVLGEMEKCEAHLKKLDKINGEEEKADKLIANNEAPRPVLGYLGFTAMRDIMYGDSAKNDMKPENIRQEAAEFVQKILNAPELKNKVKSGDNATKEVRKGIDWFNGLRLLLWVWGASMMATLLDVLAALGIGLPYSGDLLSAIGTVVVPMGFMSLYTYCFRFAVELREAVAIAFAHYQPEFAKTGFRFVEQDGTDRVHSRRKRLRSELSNRKYIMLNDLIWGAVNGITWLWLKGALYNARGGIQTLGYAGGILTLALLAFDFIMASCSYKGKRDDYFAQRQALLDEIERLKQQDNVENRALLQARQAMLEKLEFDWPYEEYKCLNNIGIAASWLIGWSVMCAFFVPGFPAAVFLALAGAVFLFVSTVIKDVIENRIDSAKLKAHQGLCHQKAEALLKEFNRIPAVPDAAGMMRKKDLYLQIKDLLAETKHDKEMISFLRMRALVMTPVHALAPVLVFVSMVFLPLGWSLIPIAAFLVMAFALSKWVDKYKPAAFEPTAALDNQGHDGTDFESLKERLEKNDQLTLADFEAKKAVKQEEVLPAPADENERSPFLSCSK